MARLTGNPNGGDFLTYLTYAEVCTLIEALDISRSARLRRYAQGRESEAAKMVEAGELRRRLYDEVTNCLVIAIREVPEN